MNRTGNTHLMKELIYLGVRPKYKAFNYLVFILSNYETDSLCRMSENDVLSAVSYEFGISNRITNRNFRTLIESFFQSTDSDNIIRRSMPNLSKYEIPTVREFIIVIACSIEEKESMRAGI